MIRQICLSCYKTVELPDDSAGKDVPCPECGKTISVPAKYAAGVAEGGGLSSGGASPPPPPPAVDPSAPPGLKAPPPPAPPPPAAGELTHGFGCSLNPVWLDWVPAGCIVLALVLTFFPWVSMTLGGYTVMSQNGWDAVFGGKAYHPPVYPPGEEQRTKQWEDLDNKLSGRADDPTAKLRTNWLIVLYVLLLVVAVVLFVAERVIRDPAKFPLTAQVKPLHAVWKWRLAALGAVAVVAFLLVWVQSFRGFGLEQSIQAMARVKYSERLTDPNPTDTQFRATWIDVGQEASKYPVHQTFWLNLLLAVHAAAVVGVAARIWVQARGATPHPRLDLRW